MRPGPGPGLTSHSLVDWALLLHTNTFIPNTRAISATLMPILPVPPVSSARYQTEVFGQPTINP